MFWFTGLTCDEQTARCREPSVQTPECKIGKPPPKNKKHRVHFMTRCLPARVIYRNTAEVLLKYCWVRSSKYRNECCRCLSCASVIYPKTQKTGCSRTDLGPCGASLLAITLVVKALDGMHPKDNGTKILTFISPVENTKFACSSALPRTDQCYDV